MNKDKEGGDYYSSEKKRRLFESEGIKKYRKNKKININFLIM